LTESKLKYSTGFLSGITSKEKKGREEGRVPSPKYIPRSHPASSRDRSAGKERDEELFCAGASCTWQVHPQWDIVLSNNRFLSFI
jgi:hypothetical protein